MRKILASGIVLILLSTVWGHRSMGEQAPMPQRELRTADKIPVFAYLKSVDSRGTVLPHLAAIWQWVSNRFDAYRIVVLKTVEILFIGVILISGFFWQLYLILEKGHETIKHRVERGWWIFKHEEEYERIVYRLGNRIVIPIILSIVVFIGSIGHSCISLFDSRSQYNFSDLIGNIFTAVIFGLVFIKILLWSYINIYYIINGNLLRS